MNFSEDKLKQVSKMMEAYPEGKQKSALLPLLHFVQKENGGWLSAEAMDYAASLLNITSIEVYEVATFYSMYNLQPVGKTVFEVCQTGPCMLRGSDDVVAYIFEKLNIKPGQTTADGLFTLKTVECLGACGYAPLMQLGSSYREHLSKEKIDQLIEEGKKEIELR
jgi:NADH-quinone oxidoreductase subunit E